MSSTKKIAVAAIVLFGATVALAGSAHFIRCSDNTQGDNLVVSFKIAGLGNETTCVTVTADATAEYACYNNGGRHPQAANKETINAEVVATDCFTPRNGQINGSLTLTPPGPGDFSCPPGQTLVFEGVTYSNVRVVDTTHNVSCTP